MKKRNKFLVIILSLTLILCIMQGVFIPVSAQETEAVQETTLSEEEYYALNKPQFSVDDDFADNRVIVVLKNEESLKFNEYKTTDFSGLGCKKVNDLTSYTGEIMKKKIESRSVDVAAVGLLNTDMFIENKISDVNVNKYNQILCLELDESGKQNVLDVIDELNARDDVLFAFPDVAISIEPSTYVDDANTIYDTLTLQEMDYMSIYDAWEINTGSSNVMVGVIDTGIEGTHPDLINNLDTTSMHRDFSNGVEIAVTTPTDSIGHGTHVAGIIGAQGDNDIGISGVCWDVNLVSLRIYDNSGVTYISYAGMAIDYANDNSIPILNLSSRWYTTDDFEEYYDMAIGSIIDNYYGLLVCSAGNEGINNDNIEIYPVDYDKANMITVGASSQNDQICNFSNYGQNTVDLFATGENILSCYDGSYEELDGTSMAAPYVAGVAALLLSEYPNMDACELKASIMENVDISSAFSSKCVSGGRLNAYEALANPVTHNLSYTVFGVVYHTVTCTTAGCGNSYTEYHHYVQVSNYYRCSDCGYTTQQLPASMQAIIPDNGYESDDQ